MLSYSDGQFVYSFPESERESFLSDLAKALFGTRSYIAIAEGTLNHFNSECPGQMPVVFEGMLLTKGEIAAEMWRRERKAAAERKAKAEARRRERAEWQAASPMAEALRKVGLAA